MLDAGDVSCESVCTSWCQGSDIDQCVWLNESTVQRRRPRHCQGPHQPSWSGWTESTQGPL